MPSYATPRQVQYPSMMPVQKQQSSSDTLRSNYYANIQVVPQNLQQGAQHGYTPSTLSPAETHCFQASPMQPAMHYFNASQMQTPPPTRGTLAKKPQQPTQIAFGTPSTIASRRFMTPQQPAATGNMLVPQQTPTQFSQLQFSPDMYQFANLGPASAPVMPQTQLLWDQMRTSAALPQPAPLEDPFAPVVPGTGAWPQPSPQPNGSQAATFETPAMASFPVQAPHPRPASAALLNSSVSMPTMQPITSASLDPSLIYSSPIRPIVRSSSRQSKTRLEPVVPATRRKDSAALRHASQSASPTEDSPASAGPGLRRSNTTSTARSTASETCTSAAEAMCRSNSATHILRTVSPLKRVGRTPLGSISERKPRPRTSVVLTIDENGNARTETRRLDDSPTKSMRERYPGLFDSDSSDDELDTSDQPPSRNASSTFAKGEERRTKAARLDPPVENLEGIDILRSSSRTSMRGVTPSRAAIAAAATLRRQGSLRRSNRTTPAKRNPMTRSTSSLIDTCPMDMSGEQQQLNAGAEHYNDSWQSAINSFDSFPSSQPTTNNTLDSHNRHWSMMSSDQQQQHWPLQHQRRNPPNFRSAQSAVHEGPLIRCICGIPTDRGQMMVQCSSCTQFLHMPCVGLDGRQIPSGYVCFLCEKPGRR